MLLASLRKKWTYCAGLLGLMVLLDSVSGQTQLRPGMNFFSVKQDVEIGREASRETEKQLDLLHDSDAKSYLNDLGKSVAKHSKNPDLPYEFKLVNSKEINAFAFPGGFIYVNRGLIEAADNESELAGVLGHEISHAALRHGTNQMSKQLLITAPLSIIGGLFGEGGGWKEQLAALGISLGVNGLMMKYSRTAESQADLAGVQAVQASNFDPEGMMTFFKKLEGLRKTQPGMLESFFASHPAPLDRERAVGEEIVKLPLLKNPQKDSQEFHKLKAKLASMPAPPAPKQQVNQPVPEQPQKVPEPSSRSVAFEQRDGLYQFEIPDNWRVVSESGAGVTIVPPGGARSYGDQTQISHGMMVNLFEVNTSRGSRLEDATDQFLDNLQHGNPHLHVVRGSQAKFNLSGQKAIRTLLTGIAPRTNQWENVWVVTRGHPDGLFYFVFVSPESDFHTYKPMFDRIVKSARFSR